jgi:hypothetical protein
MNLRVLQPDPRQLKRDAPTFSFHNIEPPNQLLLSPNYLPQAENRNKYSFKSQHQQ